MKNLLVIGAGSIGKRHIGNFNKHGVKNISVVDPNQNRLEEAKKVCPIMKTFSNYEEALSSDFYEGVVIASPTSMHVAPAIDFALNGSALFIEKPVSHNMDRLDELLKISKEKDIKTFVAYCHRFIPSIERLKNILDSKLLGEIYAFSMSWGSFLPNWHPWEDYRDFYMAKKSQGGGAFLDESHGIDLIRFLFGEIVSLSADIGQISKLEIDSDDWASLLLTTKNDIKGKAHFDLLRHDPQIKLDIICEKGTITWDRIDHQLKIFWSKEKKTETFSYTLNDVLSMYDSETRHFINCVDNKESSLIDLEDGIKTMKVIEAGFLSSENGTKIEIKHT